MQGNTQEPGNTSASCRLWQFPKCELFKMIRWLHSGVHVGVCAYLEEPVCTKGLQTHGAIVQPAWNCLTAQLHQQVYTSVIISFFSFKTDTWLFYFHISSCLDASFHLPQKVTWVVWLYDAVLMSAGLTVMFPTCQILIPAVSPPLPPGWHSRCGRAGTSPRPCSSSSGFTSVSQSPPPWSRSS